MFNLQSIATDGRKADRIHEVRELSQRDNFLRDRDRIFFSKEFRRLEGKTQVFVSGFDDQVRNRLTHTLEVAQVAGVVSSKLGLNTMLTQAIALGHDVGHTPFGHVGERVLNALSNKCLDIKLPLEDNDAGFKHNLQGIKVVSSLERISEEYTGLNLTKYTLWGIMNHTKLEYKACNDNSLCYHNAGCPKGNGSLSLSHYGQYTSLVGNDYITLEGIVVKCADEIAQRHHDIEDGIIAKLLTVEEVYELLKPFLPLMNKEEKEYFKAIKRNFDHKNVALHDFTSLIMRLYSRNLITNVTSIIDQNIRMPKKRTSIPRSQILPLLQIPAVVDGFSEEFIKIDEKLHEELKNKILNSYTAKSMDVKATYLIHKLVEAYINSPSALPSETVCKLVNNYYVRQGYNNPIKMTSKRIAISNSRDMLLKIPHDVMFDSVLVRTIIDFIAGMTDSFALAQYRMLYGSDNYWKH